MRKKNTDIRMSARKKADDLSLLLAYVVIRLDVAAKAGTRRCLANRLMHKVHGTKIC